MSVKKARRSKGSPNGNGAPMEYRALAEAYHAACYAIFLRKIEEILERDPAARARMERLVGDLRETVFSKIRF